MNQTHIHLLITHLPIFGSILGGFVLAYGLWTKMKALYPMVGGTRNMGRQLEMS